MILRLMVRKVLCKFLLQDVVCAKNKVAIIQSFYNDGNPTRALLSPDNLAVGQLRASWGWSPSWVCLTTQFHPRLIGQLFICQPTSMVSFIQYNGQPDVS